MEITFLRNYGVIPISRHISLKSVSSNISPNSICVVFNISILPKTTTFEWSWDIDTKAEQTFISDSSSVSTQLEPITKYIDSEASIINNTDGSISI